MLKVYNGPGITHGGPITFTNKSILEGKDVSHVSMGVQPSGDIHIGTLATLIQAMAAAQEGHLTVTVGNRYFDYKAPRYFQSYDFALTGGMLATEHTKKELKQAVDEIIDYFPSPLVSVTPYTDFVNEAREEYNALLEYLFLTDDGIKLVHRTMSASKKKGYKRNSMQTDLLKPTCPHCHYVSNTNPKIDRRAKTLESLCNFCNHDVSVPITDEGVYVFYLLADVRDILPVTPKVTCHFYGGDYVFEWGQARSGDRPSKAYRMRNLVNALAEKSDEQILWNWAAGPLFVWEGEKISKSHNIGKRFTLPFVREAFGKAWPERLHDILQQPTQDMSRKKCDLSLVPEFR